MTAPTAPTAIITDTDTDTDTGSLMETTSTPLPSLPPITCTGAALRSSSACRERATRAWMAEESAIRAWKTAEESANHARDGARGAALVAFLAADEDLASLPTQSSFPRAHQRPSQRPDRWVHGCLWSSHLATSVAARARDLGVAVPPLPPKVEDLQEWAADVAAIGL